MYIKNKIQDSLIVAGTSVRRHDNEDFDLGNKNPSHYENKNSLLNALGFPIKNSVFIKQTHSKNVLVVNTTLNNAFLGRNGIERSSAYDNPSEPPTNITHDAIITNLKGVLLCIFTADCYPIFLYDIKNNCIGIIHAGWRGTQKQIVINTLRTLKKTYGSKAKDILISFGPGIGVCCYEVSKEFKEVFGKSTMEKDGKLYLDLLKENKAQLLEEGILKNNILEDSYMCTYCHNDLYYSHRKENKLKQRVGRMLSFIGIRDSL